MTLLGGTVYWAHKMTCFDVTSGLKADALNLRMVFGHIGLLLAQIAVVILNSAYDSRRNSNTYFKIISTEYVINAALDTIVCLLIGRLISSFDY
jgi:hypothetical protein